MTDTKPSDILSSKAMVVKLSISRIGTSKKDSVITDKVVEEFSAGKNSGTFNKKIFVKGTLDELNDICSKMRAYHVGVTLPWNDDGARILPSAKFDEYNTMMLGFKEKFDAFVNAFHNSYEEHIEKAKESLGDMYNEEDYCTKDQVKGKFDMKFVYYPVPSAKDFRIDVSVESLNKVQAQVEADVSDRFNIAMKSAWDKSKELISRLISRLEEKDHQLKSRVIDSIREMIPLLETFNFNNDPGHTALIAEIKDKLCSHTIKDLNLHEIKCKTVVSDAKEILEKIDDYSSMFKGE